MRASRGASTIDGMNTETASAATPEAAAALMAADPTLPPDRDGDELFTLYTVLGMPFASGHVLAFRDVVASSVGPAYRAVWVRDPDERWTLITTAPAEVSCPRYWGAGNRHEQVAAIETDWPDPQTLHIRVPGRIDWRLQFGSRPSTRFMSWMGGAMPEAAWRNDGLLGAMGPVASVLLHSGHVNLRCTTPNRQHFKGAPTMLWPVATSRATLDGVGLGAPRALAHQAHIGELWIPQHGFFIAATTRYTAFDPAKHLSPTDSATGLA